MFPGIDRAIRALVVHIAILIAALFIERNHAGFFAPLPHIRDYGPALALLALGAACVWFNRHRLFFLCLAVAQAQLLLNWIGYDHDTIAHTSVVALVGLCLPLQVLAFSLWPDMGLRTFAGLGRYPLLLLPIVVLGFASLIDINEIVPHLERPWLLPEIQSVGGVAQIPLLLIGVTFTIGVARLAVMGRMIDGVFVATPVSLLFILRTDLDAWSFSIHAFGIAAMVLFALAREVYGMAYLDDLTGLPGRRAFNEALRKLGSTYTIAMLDVDHFKGINDKYGHDVGDHVLRMVADEIARVEAGGLPFRYGGEEFAVVFPGKKLVDCLPHLEVIRARIEDRDFVIRGNERRGKTSKKRRGRKISVTISIGASHCTARRSDAQAVLIAADKALYKAKEGGRNQVCEVR